MSDLMDQRMSDLVERLWAAALTGEPLATTPDTTPGTTEESPSVDEGQSLQLEMLARWIARGEVVGGYKIGLTSGQSRDAFGPGIRPFGYILQSRILRSGATFNVAGRGVCGLENELVFRIDNELPAREITAVDMRAIATSVAPGFELNQRRLGGATGNGLRVADNLSQWGIVVGNFTTAADVDLDALNVELSLDDNVVETLAARGHIDDHYESLTTLANRLRQFGRELATGDLVITGSFTRQSIKGSANWRGQFSSLGEVAIEVTQ